MQLKNHLVILVFIFLGLTIMANQVTQPVTIVKSDIEADQGNDEDNPVTGEETIILQADLVFNSISQVTPHYELYQIREIVLDEVSDPLPVHEIPDISETNHFRTLFRKVISANAP